MQKRYADSQLVAGLTSAITEHDNALQQKPEFCLPPALQRDSVAQE